MRRFLRKFFHRPAIRLGRLESGRGPCRNSRFVSFLAENNRKSLDTDFHDTVLRGRKLMRQALALMVAAGCAWIAIESAHALTVF